MPNPPKPPPVHIRDEQYPVRALCGYEWRQVVAGGIVASEGFEPPVIRDEDGSCKAATCGTCLRVWRRRVTSM